MTDESLASEITDYLQKDIIMDFTGYEERTYSERFEREDGAHVDIAACARKDEPGIVAIYYYTSPEFARNYTLTIQGLLNGYSVQSDGTIIVADNGKVVASNDECLLGARYSRQRGCPGNEKAYRQSAYFSCDE